LRRAAVSACNSESAISIEWWCARWSSERTTALDDADADGRAERAREALKAVQAQLSCSPSHCRPAGSLATAPFCRPSGSREVKAA
jgi:hypothetical protein